MPPVEISLEDIQGMAPALDEAPPPGKPARRELSLDELQTIMKPKEEGPKPSFLTGVDTNIAGQYSIAKKGMQIEKAEYSPDDEVLKGYQRELGEAQRAAQMEMQMTGKAGPAALKVQEFQGLVNETRDKVQTRLASPEIQAKIKPIQEGIRAIQAEMEGATPKDMGWWKQQAFNASVSMGVMAPALAAGIVTGGASIPLTGIGLQTYFTSYASNRANGLTPEKARSLATVDGLTESLTEMLPASKLLKNTGVFKKFLEATVADIPGELLANYIQSATAAVAALGPNATDAQIQEALKKSVKDSSSPGTLASVGVTTAMVGGAPAAVVRAAQVLRGKSEEEVVETKPKTESSRGRKPHYKNPAEAAAAAEAKAAADAAVKAATPQPKPHFKSPEEAKAAMDAAKAKSSPGSEVGNLDDILAETDALPDRPEEVIDFEERKQQKEAREGKVTPVEVTEITSPEQLDQIFDAAAHTRQRQDIDAALVAGDISEESHAQMLDQLNGRTKAKEQVRQEISDFAKQYGGLQNLSEDGLETARDMVNAAQEKGAITQDEAAGLDQMISNFLPEAQARREAKKPGPLTFEEMVQFWSNGENRRRGEEFAGPAPKAPKVTGDRMADRAEKVRFERELREWMGEAEPGETPASKAAAAEDRKRDQTRFGELLAERRAAKKPAKNPLKDVSDENLQKMGEDLWTKYIAKDISFEELNAKMKPINQEIFRRERIPPSGTQKGSVGNPHVAEIYPGFGPRIKVGTKIQAQHGSQELQTVTIVGYRKPIKYKRGDGHYEVVIPHLAKFADGKIRVLTQGNIKEVSAPRPADDSAVPRERREVLNNKLRRALDTLAGQLQDGDITYDQWAEQKAKLQKSHREEMDASGRPEDLSKEDLSSSWGTPLFFSLMDLWTSTKPVFAKVWEKAETIYNAEHKNDKMAAYVLNAAQLLDMMQKKAEGPYKDVLTLLQQFMDPAATIEFQYTEFGDPLWSPPMIEGGPLSRHPTATGLYVPGYDGPERNNTIIIRAEPGAFEQPDFIKTIVHEMWHSVTFDYLWNNPNAPIVKELKDLLTKSRFAIADFMDELEASGIPREEVNKFVGGRIDAELNADGKPTSIKFRGALYGLTNIGELVVEANASPLFMKLLGKASPRAQGAWAKIVDLYKQITEKIALALGFKKHEAQLLQEVMAASFKLAELQKADKAKKAKQKAPPQAEDAREPPRKTLVKKTADSTMRPSVVRAMELLGSTAAKVPGVKALGQTVAGYMDEVQRLIAPETRGDKAEHTGAILSKWITNQMRLDASYQHQSQNRRDFWERNADKAREFVKMLEQGWTPKDPQFKEIAEGYRAWNQRIFKQEETNGIQYEPIDNYFYHIFKDHEGVAEFFKQKYGTKWGDPKFMKERSYDLYEEAIAAGFTPLYTNPEDIMLARQHASDVATMKVQTLEELYQAGLAWKEKPKGVKTTPWRSPNGDWFYVHDQADAILNNAWNTRSLWARSGLVGGLFKGAMYLKNKIVPIKLSISLFHFLHVLTINNATGMVRATKGLLMGNQSAGSFLADMSKASAYTDLISAPQMGGRIRDIFAGKIAPENITDAEALAIQYMVEGGMMPEQSHQYKNNARVQFKNALLRARKNPLYLGKAAYEAPFAALDWMQHWMFEKWIPSIKVASYLNDVQTAIQSDPTIVVDQQRRQQVFHKLAKSVDNRHGEMVYKTMFWNKWVKDLAVVNLLSLGWQMGFIREYGGGVGDLAKLVTRKGGLKERIARGELDRPLFVAFYTAQSLMYGGLLTWAFTGEPPDEWKDYYWPAIGKDDNGKDKRINTMFYSKEFASIAEHIKQDGVLKGLSKTAVNKASGIFGITGQVWTGLDDFGKEYRDPNGTKMEKLVQTMDYVMEEMTPISVGGILRGDGSIGSFVRNVAGFSDAPAYATRGEAEAAIRKTWTTYNAKTQTSFERAAYSKEMKELREAYDEDDYEKYDAKFDSMVEQFQLTAEDRKNIRKALRRERTPEQSMFQSLTWQQQKRLLDKMSDEDREIYLPYSNRAHLRNRYETPEEVE